jgi:hypothetical protein
LETSASVKAGNRVLPNCVKLITRSRRMEKKKNTNKEEHEEERRE